LLAEVDVGEFVKALSVSRCAKRNCGIRERLCGVHLDTDAKEAKLCIVGTDGKVLCIKTMPADIKHQIASVVSLDAVKECETRLRKSTGRLRLEREDPNSQTSTLYLCCNEDVVVITPEEGPIINYRSVIPAISKTPMGREVREIGSVSAKDLKEAVAELYKQNKAQRTEEKDVLMYCLFKDAEDSRKLFLWTPASSSTCDVSEKQGLLREPMCLSISLLRNALHSLGNQDKVSLCVPDCDGKPILLVSGGLRIIQMPFVVKEIPKSEAVDKAEAAWLALTNGQDSTTAIASAAVAPPPLPYVAPEKAATTTNGLPLQDCGCCKGTGIHPDLSDWTLEMAREKPQEFNRACLVSEYGEAKVAKGEVRVLCANAVSPLGFRSSDGRYGCKKCHGSGQVVEPSALAKFNQESEAKKAKHAQDVAANNKALWAKAPAWSSGVILAELEQDECDSMTDYYATSTSKYVAIGWMRGERQDFKQLRAAAATYEPTRELATDPKAEHRENWAGGAGYYLKHGTRYCSGWKVRVWWHKYSMPYSMVEDCTPTHKPAESRSPESAGTVSAHIEKHFHDKHKTDYWLVVANKRVSRSEWQRLTDVARTYGGWYARAWQEIPGGWGFSEEAKAKEFMAVNFSTTASPVLPEVKKDAEPQPSSVVLAAKQEASSPNIAKDKVVYAQFATNKSKSQQIAALCGAIELAIKRGLTK
jgi:hypothetical protein